MSARDFDRAMERWNGLRADLDDASKRKSHRDVVNICDAIVALSTSAPDVGIVAWMFDRRAAKALADAKLHGDAIARLDRAITGCTAYRARARLRSPEDFLSDLQAMEKLRARWQAKRATAGP